MAESLLTATEPAPEPEGNWRDQLPEDLRDAGSLKDIPDVPTLAKAYTDAQSFIGRSVRIPGEDASEDTWTDFRDKLKQVPGIGIIPTSQSSEDDWGHFYNSLGRPEKPEDYNIVRPEGTEPNEEAELGLLQKLHSLGLNNTQASDLVNWMNEGLHDVQEVTQADQQQALDLLHSDWGMAFDTKMKDAKAALTKYGGDDLVQELDTTGLGNNVALIKAFAEIGKGFSENPAMNTGDSNSFRVTPAEAREQINEILGNSAHPYNDGQHPSHASEVDRVSKLYQVAYQSDVPQTEFGARFEAALTRQPSQ
jgi:hypothetical protein